MKDCEISMSQVGSFNPNASESITNIYNSAAPTRMSAYYRQLHQEILDKTPRDVLDDLLYYYTKQYDAKGVEEKLQDSGFTARSICVAMHQKQQFAKKASQFDCYPAAQEINLLFFTDIISAFSVYVAPMIESELPVDAVMERIHEKVVLPIMAKINENGEYDLDLHYTTDHIYGMIYFLTDMCHLNWKKE